MRAQKITLEIVMNLLVMLWVYAAVSKLLDYKTFTVQLSKSPLLTSFAPLLAILVPLIELAIALLLVRPQTLLLGLYSSLFLLVLFTCYLVAILNFSYQIPCSCGGIIGKGMSWTAHIIFNLGFAVISLFGILIQERRRKQFTPFLSTAGT